MARGYVVESRRVVVWRDAEGGVHVWNDHCPHRGEPLSSATVSGGLITCPAHGWRFDVNGQRVRFVTPSTSHRSTACVVVYAATECDGLVLARFDGAVPDDDSSMPPAASSRE